jgi:predicted amidohydrolase YtcJ
VILENGVVRTLDPQLPIARALAISGDRIAGGVGVHETALPSPDVVDLGGRYVIPGLTATGAFALNVDVDALRAAANELAARGVTCVHETSGAVGEWQDLRARTLLPVRVRVFVTGDVADALAAAGIRSGFGDELIRLVFAEIREEDVDPWSHVRNAEDLAAVSVDPAQLTGEQRQRGRLLPGYLADLVVVDQDPVTLAADELRPLQPLATMVGGRWVQNPPPWPERAS